MRAVPSVLDEGGFASVMISWVQDSADAAARPRAWLERSGCDAYLIHTRTEDPLSRDAAWNLDLAQKPPEYARAIDEWTSYFEREGITAIAYGGVVLRRRSDADNWFYATRLPQRGFGVADRFLRRVFTNLDTLAADGLEEREVAIADDARLEQVLRPGAGWTTESLALRLTDGLPFEASLDEYSAEIVRRLDGSKPLGAALRDAAAAADVDRAEFEAAGLELVRQMASQGFLVFNR